MSSWVTSLVHASTSSISLCTYNFVYKFVLFYAEISKIQVTHAYLQLHWEQTHRQLYSNFWHPRQLCFNLNLILITVIEHFFMLLHFFRCHYLQKFTACELICKPPICRQLNLRLGLFLFSRVFFVFVYDEKYNLSLFRKFWLSMLYV